MIIGISAKMGCGKSTLAKIFLEEYPKFKRIAFGDVLKAEASITYGYPLRWNYTEEGKSKVVNFDTSIQSHSLLPKPLMQVREVLQWHGTEYRRAQDPDYWVKQMEKFLLNNENVIIDDVRFPNEAELILANKGLLIRIHPYKEWKPNEFANHISETALDNFNKFNLYLFPEFGKLEKHMPIITEMLTEMQQKI